MTREEAINVLNDYDINFERNTAEEVAEAHDIAIKTLEQQVNTELIIKTTIKEYLDKFYLDTNELLIDLNHDLCERIRSEELSEKVVHLNAENKPRLSKPAFVVLDQLIKEHKDLYGCITFKTFTGGRHQCITTNQLIKELDELYNYYYKKGEESGEGTK